MRRVWVMVTSVALVVAFGCGRENYQKRLNRTLEQLEYARRLKKNLMEPPNDKRFTELAIYLRPPKDLVQAKAGQLPVAEGQFDLDATFSEKSDAFLHVLARVKMPKKAATKGAPPPPPPPQRGPFEADVLSVLSSFLNAPEGLQTPKFSEENKKLNRFKRLIFIAGDKEVKLYTIKQDNHEVALIFAYDPKLRGALSSKIDLCLESFLVGPKATRAFNGGASEEETESSPVGPL